MFPADKAASPGTATWPFTRAGTIGRDRARLSGAHRVVGCPAILAIGLTRDQATWMFIHCRLGMNARI